MENLNFASNGHSPEDVPRESPLQEYLAIILRGKWIILFSVVLVTAASAFFTFRTKPIYEASSLVLINLTGRSGSMPFLDLTGASSASKITNEIQILKSRSMAEAVAEALLKKIYLDESNKKIIPVLQVYVDGELREGLASVGTVTGRLLGSVDFVPIRDSDILRIIAKSTNPVEAALVANTYTDVYVERNINASRVRSKSVREFLQTQLQTRKQALDGAEDALSDYMRTTGMVSLEGPANKVVTQISSLEAARDGIEIEMQSRLQTLASYKEEIKKQAPDVAKEIWESDDAYIRLLQDQIARLQVQHDVVIAQNPELAGQAMYSEKLKEIDSQIASLRKNLQARTESFLKSMLLGGEGSASFVTQARQKIIEEQISLDGLAARKKALAVVIADYEKQFNQIPQKSIELARLQRARLSSEKLYLLVEEKFNEAAITEKSEFGYVDIVDPAIVPGSPVSPNVQKNLMLGALMGLGLGIAIVLLRAYLDVRIRTPEDLKRYGYAPLAAINRMDDEIAKLRLSRSGDATEENFDAHLVAYHNPLSSLAESYRRLRTNVQYAQVDKPLKNVMVTSANPSEGKTTTVANLAVAFAQTEKRILLVDADMRRPTIHSAFGLPKTPGLNELLFGTATFDEVAHKNVLDNLDVITCGTIPPNPAEILGSRKMKEFIETTREQYDLVLYDSPPLLAVTDAAVLATGVDGALLVIYAGQTRVAAIERAAEFLEGIGGKVMGVVLNNFDLRKAYGGYYGSYSYGYHGYGKSYEYTYSSNGGSAKKRVRKTKQR